MEAGRREAVLAMADALDDESRELVWHAYADAGHGDLADVADAAQDALEEAETVVRRTLTLIRIEAVRNRMNGNYRNGKEI
jgi:hypothetical protein